MWILLVWPCGVRTADRLAAAGLVVPHPAGSAL